MPQDQTYLEQILKGILQFPEKLNIVRTTDQMGVLLFVQVDKADMGRLLGKNGDTINAIRTIINTFGYGQREKISVKVEG